MVQVSEYQTNERECLRCQSKMTNEYNCDFTWIKLIQQIQQVNNKKLKQIKSKRCLTSKKQVHIFHNFWDFNKNFLKIKKKFRFQNYVQLKILILENTLNFALKFYTINLKSKNSVLNFWEGRGQIGI